VAVAVTDEAIMKIKETLVSGAFKPGALTNEISRVLLEGLVCSSGWRVSTHPYRPF